MTKIFKSLPCTLILIGLLSFTFRKWFDLPIFQATVFAVINHEIQNKKQTCQYQKGFQCMMSRHDVSNPFLSAKKCASTSHISRSEGIFFYFSSSWHVDSLKIGSLVVIVECRWSKSLCYSLLPISVGKKRIVQWKSLEDSGTRFPCLTDFFLVITWKDLLLRFPFRRALPDEPFK